MIVHFTKNAIQNMDDIFDYHSDYSMDYASEFHRETVSRIIDNLSGQPEMGAVYNPDKSIRRLVLERHNVYYLHKSNAVFVLFIIGARLDLNANILEPDFVVPDLI